MKSGFPIFALIILCAFQASAQGNYQGFLKVGLLIPEDQKKDSTGLSAVHAAQLAIKHTDLEVELFVRSCEGPWGVTSKQVVDFVYEDEVDALITSVDGRNAHLAEQVATKTHKSLISARASDPTITQAYVPWFFRVTPDDRKQAQALKKIIFSRNQSGSIVIIHPDNYNATYSAKYFMEALDPGQKRLIETIIYDPLTSKFQPIINRLASHKQGTVILLGSGRYTMDLIKSIHTAFPEIKLLGNQMLIETGSQIRSLPDEMRLVIPEGWGTDLNREFIEIFENTFNYKPGIVACYAYDAMNILIDAVKSAGTDHDPLRQALMQTDHVGVTGKIQFNEFGNRTSDSRTGYVRGGWLINH